MGTVQENKDEDTDNILIEMSYIIRANPYLFQNCKKVKVAERKAQWMKNQKTGF